MEDDEVI